MTYDRELNFNYFSPTKVIFGINTLNELPMEIGALGSKALLVTDAGLEAAGLVDSTRRVMGHFLVGVYADIPQDSGMDVVDRGAQLALSLGADVVVSLGGGSVIDTAKGMCVVMKEGGSIRDYQGAQMLTRPQTPHIVIPTTAGTGSEVSAGAVIFDQEQQQKIIFNESFNIPRVAILDPLTTEHLPPGLTASTGMDALTHAIESYTTSQRNPMADAAALHAIRLIMNFLPRAVQNGSDLTARGQMQIAALLAGMAFTNSVLGLVHAMAHSLGAVCKTPHGLANGILLPHVMAYNREEIGPLLGEIAAVMGVDAGRSDPDRSAGPAIEKVEALIGEIGLPRRLRDAGVDEARLVDAAELSMSDAAIICNPKMVFEPEEVLKIYQAAY